MRSTPSEADARRRTIALPARKGGRELFGRLGRVFWRLLRNPAFAGNGVFWVKPYAYGLLGWLMFSFLNPQRYGQVIRSFPRRSGDLELFEADVISQLISLFGGSPRTHSGFVISGASEGNILSLWAGKTHCSQSARPNLMLFTTSLTHESVRKGAHMMGIPTKEISLNARLGVSVPALGSAMISALREGKNGFLYCATLGYKETGSSDDYEAIHTLFEDLKTRRPCRTFLWVDAAYDGLIAPFSPGGYAPFLSNGASSAVVDFHKLGLVPAPSAALILDRAYMGPLSDGEVPGFLESRSALPVVAAWASFYGLGQRGFIRLCRQAQQKREIFLASMSDAFRSRVMAASPQGTTLFFRCLKSRRADFKDLEERYPLRYHMLRTQINGVKTTVSGVKIYFLPSLSFAKLRDMTRELIQRDI